jgi:hypothetical protein
LDEQLDVGRVDTGQSGYSMTPLAKAAVKPAGHGYGEAHPGVRVVESEDDVSPSSTPVHARRQKQARSRYYSGLSNAWKRISQIGRAY